MIDFNKALKQLKELEKLGVDKRLAADGWDADWKILIATLMSARTMDKVTIPIAERLFSRFNSIEKLASASEKEIAEIIIGVNFYKGKAKRVRELAFVLFNKYGGKVPHNFYELVELPGVGRKTANVFLAEKGMKVIGVDTHVGWISKQMGWTDSDKQERVEKDLKEIFPESYWGKINWILVRFGQTFPSRRKKLEILNRVKEL